MKYFSSDFINQIRSANDIIALIGDDINLKEKGDRYLGLCPFPDHQEKTPSFSCSQSKQVYYCFGCQKSGDIFTYLQEKRGMSFIEAIKYLADRACIPLPKVEFVKQSDNLFPLYDMNQSVCEFYEQQLSKSSSAQEYLKKRGYDQETVKKFRIGYAPKGNALLALLNTDQKKNVAFTLGLLNKKDGKFYDTYRNRIVFPIVSLREQVVGFGARTLGDGLPKYINSKESKIFYKGKIFYGLQQSSLFLKNKKSALVVEGYTDLISLWQSDVKNVVATLGTALTSDHAKLLRRYVSLVILIFDGDEAGARAMERSCSIWLSEGFEVKGITLPKNQDPDTFVKEQGAEALEKLIQNSEDLFFKILKKKLAFLKENKKSLHHLINEMVPLLKQIKNPPLQVLYKQRVLDCFGTDSRAMEKILNESLRSYKTPSLAFKKEIYESKKQTLPQLSLSSALPAERILLALTLDSEERFKKFFELGGLELLKSEEVRDIFKKLEVEYRQNQESFARLLPSIMNQVKEKHWLLTDFYPVLKIDNPDKLEIFQDCLSFLRKRKTQSEANQLVAKIKMSDKEEFRNLEKVFDLTKERLNKKNL